jgi:hypothetical protein
LVYELAAMDVVGNEDLSPKFWTAALHEIASLLLEHRILVCHDNKLVVAEALRIGNVC